MTRGTVDPDNPPIAGEGGIAASDGLTTRWQYDDDLTDAAGLDASFSTHLTGLGLGTDSDGSAVLVTNGEGERTLSVRDGLGRTVRTVQLDSAGAMLTKNDTTYDAVVTITGFGDVVETAVANALGHTSRIRTDAAGRTIQTVDAENYVTAHNYDANGNRLSVRDPNNIGEDCAFDALNRRTACTDTGNHTTGTAYDLAGNVKTETDAKNASATSVYDARNRRKQTTDRIAGVTQWTYDANGNQLSITDAESQTTSYEYDTRNLRVNTTWPDHVAGTLAGDQDYGITEVAYDAAGRPLRSTDQLGDTLTLNRDLAGRLTSRDYRTRMNSPSGTISDSDTFTYDAAGRVLTAVKGRYNNTVTFTYDDGGRIATEALTVGATTWTIGHEYDGAGRRMKTTYPSTNAVDFTYTARGQLDTLVRGTTTIASFAYDGGGRETSRTYGNGVVRIARTLPARTWPTTSSQSIWRIPRMAISTTQTTTSRTKRLAATCRVTGSPPERAATTPKTA